jgi:hypothetical protein
LDDLPLKAVLQPWNYLCVSEYESERRNLDVKIAERERERTWLAEQDRVKEIAEEEEMARDGTATDADMAAVKSSENPTTEVENNEAERERKRKEKKLFKKEKLLLAKEQQLEVQGNGVEEEESYDELLLAVIGILDALKHEGNVAGWMRGGGLVRVVGGDQETLPPNPRRFSLSPSLFHLPYKTLLDQETTGVPLFTFDELASSTTPTGNNMNSASTPTPTPVIPQSQYHPLLWYERPCVLSHWVQRGRKALAELGIDIIHGVVPKIQNGNGNTGGGDEKLGDRNDVVV